MLIHEAPGTHLQKPELTSNNSKRMLNFSLHIDLEFFNPLKDGIGLVVFVERRALSRLYRDLLSHICPGLGRLSKLWWIPF